MTNDPLSIIDLSQKSGPGHFFMDLYKVPFRQLPASKLFPTLESSTDKPQVRLFIEGVNLEGDEVRRGLLLPLAEGSTSEERLQGSGLTLLNFNNEIQITQVKFGSVADKLGFEQGYKITGLEVPVDRPAKEWVYLVALCLLAGVVASQKFRGKPR
jgi:hypothetical protein